LPAGGDATAALLGHGRGTEHRVKAVANGHQRSIKPQLSGHRTPSAILDVEEVTAIYLVHDQRLWLWSAGTRKT
jgi:hypothetical protein